LLDYYVHQLSEQKEQLLKVSDLLVVDAYFSRKPFVEGALANGFCLVSKLAKNAVLKYPHLGPHPKRRGRKTKYAGKVDVLNPSEEHSTPCLQDEDMMAYEGKVYINIFDRMVKCILVHIRRKDGSLKAEVFFLTDVSAVHYLVLPKQQRETFSQASEYVISMKITCIELLRILG
jgi:hypothetical protein